MTKIIMDDMKKTRADISKLLLSVQNGCRLAIKLISDDPEFDTLVDKIRSLEESSNLSRFKITEDLSNIVGKLFLAGLLKRAVVCDAVIAYEGEAMLDLLDSLAQNWRKLKDAGCEDIKGETVILLDSMLQNCIVMLEKTIEILDGKFNDKNTLDFISEIDRNVNQANTKAHEVLLTKGVYNKDCTIRLLRTIKSIENLGDKIKSTASYILFIRTGEFIKV